MEDQEKNEKKHDTK